MKSSEPRVDGSEPISDGASLLFRLLLLTIALMLTGHTAFAQLYKYRGPDGEWIYTDKAPDDSSRTEVRDLQRGEAEPTVDVSSKIVDGQFSFIAKNDFYAPVEVILALDTLNNLQKPPPLQKMRWTVPARSTITLMQLAPTIDGQQVSAEVRFIYLRGDPESQHRPTQPYRAPFAIASRFMVTQAFPNAMTHVTPDSYYAVDFEMPVGTNIYAARSGVVFDVAGTNFAGGTDPDKYIDNANLIRILHDDGTYAVYAHLNKNTVRVRLGEQVVRGQYIADSGNTGFSSGPHLHFAVIRNKGMGLESLPLVFEGVNGSEVQPATGEQLTAH